MINLENTENPDYDSQPLYTPDMETFEQRNVQKSRPMLSLWDSRFSLAEFKILDAYLARIDSRYPDQRWVCFTKGELERLLGVQKINIRDLKNRLNNLGQMVHLEDPLEKNGFVKISLFELADCTLNEDGTWCVNLICTSSAMRYIFGIENVGYLRYKLRSVIDLTSRYSYLLFLYLEQNRFRTTWDISVEDLRTLLGCVDTYPTFKRLNQQVLQKCKTELYAKTQCRFTYEPLKRGKSIYAVRFHVLPLQNDPAVLQKTNNSLIDADRFNWIAERSLLANGKPEFSQNEMRQIAAILQEIVHRELPNSTSNDQLFFMKSLFEKSYADLNLADTKSRIKSRFRYLIKILQNNLNALVR